MSESRQKPARNAATCSYVTDNSVSFYFVKLCEALESFRSGWDVVTTTTGDIFIYI